MRARDRKLVDEPEELAEGFKERPVGEQADAFVGIYRTVWDHLLLHCSEEAQLDLLLFTQKVHWVRLVELDSRSINLE